VLKKDFPYGKIIETLLLTQPLMMLPGFPVPIPGNVFLTAAPIFPVAFDSEFLEIVYENPSDNPAKLFSVCWALRKTGRSRMQFVLSVVVLASI
jgi:hypothetical protein